MGQIKDHLKKVDAVMLGRVAMDDAYLFSMIDREIFDKKTPQPSRREVVERYIPYVEKAEHEGIGRQTLIRPLMGLYFGEFGGRTWRRAIGEAPLKDEPLAPQLARILDHMEKLAKAV